MSFAAHAGVRQRGAVQDDNDSGEDQVGHVVFAGRLRQGVQGIAEHEHERGGKELQAHGRERHRRLV